MKMVSATMSAIARGPTWPSATSEALMPRAALAATMHQREASPSAVCTDAGIRCTLFKSTMATKATRNSGTTAGRLPLSGNVDAARQKRDHEHRRHEQRDAQELNDGGNVAALLRDGIAGADDLRDVVNRAAQKHSGLRMGEMEDDRHERVEHHCQRAQRGDTDDRERGVAIVCEAARQHRGDSGGGRGAADGDRPGCQHAKASLHPR